MYKESDNYGYRISQEVKGGLWAVYAPGFALIGLRKTKKLAIELADVDLRIGQRCRELGPAL